PVLTTVTEPSEVGRPGPAIDAKMPSPTRPRPPMELPALFTSTSPSPTVWAKMALALTRIVAPAEVLTVTLPATFLALLMLALMPSTPALSKPAVWLTVTLPRPAVDAVTPLAPARMPALAVTFTSLVLVALV